MEDLTGFQRDLLRAVALLGEPKGLEIKSHLESTEQYRHVNHGRLYPNLDTLVEKGLIHKDTKDGRTNEYRVTRRGAREVGEHSDSWSQAKQNASEAV